VLAVEDSGTFYSVNRTATTAEIYTVDVVTGATTLLGTNALSKLSALAFQPPPLEPLYAVDGADNNPTTLYRLDPRNGAVLQTIGPVGFSHVTGLAFHPVTGVLYAATSGISGGGSGELLTIDVETGAGTAVGLHGMGFGPPDIAFAPSGVLYAWTEDSDDLATIDLTTGAATVVGACAAGTAATGLAVDAAGRAWMKSGGTLYPVDRTTGACGAGAALTGGAGLNNILTANGRSTFYSADRDFGVGITELRTVDPVIGDTVSVGTNAIAELSALAFRPHPLPPLYATDGAGLGGGGGPSTLYRLDPRDGSVIQTIGPIGFNEVVGLAFHPVTGVLYGTSNGGGGQLIRIDPKTGAGIAVGPTGPQIPDLSFAPSGTLYGWDEPSNDDLVTINLTTGAVTTVGNCGLGTGQLGLAVDVTGNLRMKSSTTLYSVDRVTGACSGSVALSAPGSLHNSLAYAPGGILYSLERQGGTTEIFTIDAQTGAVRSVGTNAIATLAALAFKPVRPTSLYASDGSGDGAGGGGNPSHLYLLDPDDASVVANLGPLGFTHAVGLDFHPVTRTLYATTNDTSNLLVVDPETGAGTAVGVHAGQLPDIDFAPSGILYGWDESTDDLVRIDLGTGALTTIGDCAQFTANTALAIDEEGTAYMKSRSLDRLVTVDRVTGACTTLIALSALTHNALAFDDRGRLYTLERSGGTAELHTIDIATGVLSSIGTNDLGTLSALAFRPHPHPVLYAADGSSGNASTLYRLDARNASILQTVGPIGFSEVVGLAFQPSTGALYGNENTTDQLLTIDRNTGAGTAVGTILAGEQVPDLSFSRNGVLYGWDEPSPDNLIRIDLTSGAGTTIGDCTASTAQTGLAIDQFDNAYLKSSTELYSINLATGACTLQIAALSGPTLHNGLDFNDQGTLYTIARTGGLGELYTVDPQTGTVTFVGANAISNLAAAEFMPEPAGMLLAGAVAVFMLGAWRRRRM
ncbi:MAG: hypothetical protein L0206_20195, partial [Actinobacteria bacterium]|nr:hypothetical protein [Actinomycetota bacterium]